jgi:mRNA interferase MazF
MGVSTRIGTRPVAIVSSDFINQSLLPTVLMVPFTTADRGMPTHVAVDPPEGGLLDRSFALCELVLPLPRAQMIRKMGRLSSASQDRIDPGLADVLSLIG